MVAAGAARTRSDFIRAMGKLAKRQRGLSPGARSSSGIQSYVTRRGSGSLTAIFRTNTRCARVRRANSPPARAWGSFAQRAWSARYGAVGAMPALRERSGLAGTFEEAAMGLLATGGSRYMDVRLLRAHRSSGTPCAPSPPGPTVSREEGEFKPSCCAHRASLGRPRASCAIDEPSCAHLDHVRDASVPLVNVPGGDVPSEKTRCSSVGEDMIAFFMCCSADFCALSS